MQGPKLKIVISCKDCHYLEFNHNQNYDRCVKLNNIKLKTSSLNSNEIIPDDKCPYLYEVMKTTLDKELSRISSAKKTEIHKILTEIFYDSYDFEWENENEFSIKVDAFNKNDYKKLEDSLPNYNFDLSPHSDDYFTISFGLKK